MKNEVVEEMEKDLEAQKREIESENKSEEERKPATKQEIEMARLYWKCYNHVAGKRTFRDEYNLILEKKSELPVACRNFIILMSETWPNEEL